eukprot:6173739-Pleurochrysis_carterae.AAC.3
MSSSTSYSTTSSKYNQRPMLLLAAYADSKRKLVMAAYTKAAHFYSYAAAEDKNPRIMRWIGRDIKRLINAASKHLPLILCVAAAPPDLFGAWQFKRYLNMHCVAARPNSSCGDALRVAATAELELEKDEELQVGNDEAAAKGYGQSAPDMMWHARHGDNSLALVEQSQKAWAEPDDDTDEYRKESAVRLFNADISPLSPLSVVSQVAHDLLVLNTEMNVWVLHVMCFVVLVQTLELGDPLRRSCDACESLGSIITKLGNPPPHMPAATLKIGQGAQEGEEVNMALDFYSLLRARTLQAFKRA